jgi:hypothetical protein
MRTVVSSIIFLSKKNHRINISPSMKSTHNFASYHKYTYILWNIFFIMSLKWNMNSWNICVSPVLYVYRKFLRFLKKGQNHYILMYCMYIALSAKFPVKKGFALWCRVFNKKHFRIFAKCKTPCFTKIKRDLKDQIFAIFVFPESYNFHETHEKRKFSWNLR